MAKPEIRLKGFKGEWENKLLGNLCSVNRGVRVTRKELNNQGDYPVFQNTDYPMGFYNQYNVAGNNPFVIIGGSAGLIGFSKKEFWAADDCVYFGDNAELDKAYLFNILLKHSSTIKKNVRGSSVPRLDRKVLVGLSISIPSIDEQQGIADYFKSLDSMIQGVTKKIASLKQMKQACLVSMFPQAGETTPRVRFKGFKGEWEIVKLSSIAKRITRKNSQLESTLPLTISAAEGLIEQTAFFNNVVASSNVSGYYLLKKGEFAYNKSYSNGYPFGAVKRLDKYEMGVLSTLYIVFSVDESVSSDYIVHFFDTSLWHKEVAMRAAEGARNHGLLNIGAEDFLDIDIFLPKDISEQQQIASFFTSLDKQISLQEARLEKLKQIKAACLDKMFV